MIKSNFKQKLQDKKLEENQGNLYIIEPNFIVKVARPRTTSKNKYQLIKGNMDLY